MPNPRTFNPGTLNRSITLRFPVIVQDEIGGKIEGWADLGNVFANWAPGPVAEFFGGDAKQSEATGTFRIRYRSDVVITAQWRILWEGRLYELSGPPVDIGYKHLLDLEVRQLTVADASELYPTARAFMVNLAEGDETKAVVYPTPFNSNPRGLFIQLIIPTDGYTFNADVIEETRTPTGFTVQLGAAVPGSGYKLSIQAAL